MNTILVIDSAASGEASVSKTLVREAVAALTAGEPARVVRRDLGARAGAAPDRGEPRRRPRHAPRPRPSTPPAPSPTRSSPSFAPPTPS